MPALRPPARSAGFSLLELLLVTSMVATLAALSIPVTAGAPDELRTAMAARYLEGRIMNARMTAVRRSAKVALRFEVVDDDYRFGATLLDSQIDFREFLHGSF